MRIVASISCIGSLLTLCALTGCGGGDSAVATTTPSVQNSTTTRGDAPVPHIGEQYTITDLGSTEYYYSYYGYISNRYRYNGVLRLNDSGHIITNTASQPTLYDGQPRPLNNQFGYSTINGLNNSSNVVGVSYGSPSYRSRATLWSGTEVNQLDTSMGDTWSVGYAINDQGAVVGLASQEAADWYSTPTLATRWENGVQTTLGTLGGNYSLAYGINVAGVVVGWSQLTSSGGSYYDWHIPIHAFVWEQGTIADLGVLAGGSSSDAQDINDAGQIVGSSDSAPQGLYSYRPLRAVTWINRVIKDLGTMGGPGSIAYALNNSGVIVGSGDTAALAPQSTYYGWYLGGGGSNTGGGVGGGQGGGGGGTPTNNDPPLMNGAGGRSAKVRTRGIGDTYVSHAFRYQNGKMEDLNALIAIDSGWELLTATDINRNGLIVGYGKFGNKQHAFLLTPKQ